MSAPLIPAGACGAWWQSDAGPMFCVRGDGHDGSHLVYGSLGPIEWRSLDAFEADFYRAVVESIAEDAFGCEPPTPEAK